MRFFCPYRLKFPFRSHPIMITKDTYSGIMHVK